MSDDRELGVDFGDLEDDLEGEEYPLHTDDVLEKYGDRRIEHANGSESLAHILGPLDQTYESADAVKQSVFNMIGEEAEGRLDYSDRGLDTESDESF